MNILVLCTGNSARSIMLESILNHLGEGRVTAFSAGSQPVGQVNPSALTLLTRLGHATTQLRSKSWDEFSARGAPDLDVVITVCNNAAEDVCPIWHGTPTQAHWGISDPASASESDREREFAKAYAILESMARSLLSLPLETMNRDALSTELRRIGQA